MGMNDAMIVKWLVKEGDDVKKGDPLVEVESAKVNSEVESPGDGKIGKILNKEEEVVPVGDVLVIILEEGETLEDINIETPPPEQEINNNNLVKVEASSQIKKQVTPRARQLAKKLNVDLNIIEGTGPSGRIVEEDVEKASKGETIIGEPLTGLRVTISRRMTESNLIPSVTLVSKVDITNVVNFQKELLSEWRKSKIRPNIQDLVVFALSRALVKHSDANAHFSDGRIAVLESINLGIAFSVLDGLIVPVIKNANKKDLLQIAQEIRDISKRQKQGKLTVEDMSESSFSLTSLNASDVDFFNPMINPPEIGILGIGRISEEPGVNKGNIEIRKYLYLNLTFDHRAWDGAPASAFLDSIIKNLQEIDGK
jgi:pyruvate dehydrogenase E2 component (dihydrolipoamide acetyltransferase)